VEVLKVSYFSVDKINKDDAPMVVLIINVAVCLIVRDVMILMRVNPFSGPLEWMGLESRDFFWP
jgi:hypothetical protein